ncbi:MAG: tRNA glutamyl-Q(34) synthetase GluQRS [Gammaproteobacteria bacterium]|nr:tRNA glutamyl-Q(34) synthetase GluQRS [Gammaproteobacteria bacterium]MBU1416345.1 tRNA glutamyl-Q(34) synthetase GluQRS [Gammaproteobacteria bacterium]
MNAANYVGRFAPSPTGPLHFGALVAALGSCLEARARRGRWLVRMEDVDEPRCSQKAADGILRTLEAFGFEWDGAVMVQSARKECYREALERLKREHRVYPCACTRRELADSALAPDGATIYPGTCRNGLPPGKSARAWRLRVDESVVCFDDAVQGRICQNLAREVGDFVLLRADGYFAYQLAVVVDDADQGVTHVVRGADLLDSTPRQIYLHGCFGLTSPQYTHLPVAVNTVGEKLSKQTRAAPIDERHPLPALVAAMRFLGQEVPADIRRTTTADFWAWAVEAWRLDRVPRRRTLAAIVPAPIARDADGDADGRIGKPAGGAGQQ